MKESSGDQIDLPHQLEETSDSTTKESSSGGSKPTEKTASSTLPTSSVSMKSVVWFDEKKNYKIVFWFHVKKIFFFPDSYC